MTYGLRKAVAFISALVIICVGFAAYINMSSGKENNVYAEEEPIADVETTGKILTLQIANPLMQVNGMDTEIDPGNGTSPLIVSGRTLVPIRAIIENMDGSVEWNAETRETLLTYNGNKIKLTIDSETAYLNDDARTLDVAPAIINSRTMLPIRFIAEGFGFDVDWNEEDKIITVEELKTVTTKTPETTETAPVVYMTKDITSEALVAIYEQLGFEAEGKVAVKISTGEPPASNYLRPELIKDLVQKVDGTIVECNTAYGGSRAVTTLHKQVAKDHGFTAIADVDIMDEDGSMVIPISAQGTTIQENYVGSHLANYDSLISLAHFKGHAMAGFGGAIKNMSIGIASSEGKGWIHSGGTMKQGNIFGGDQDAFLEAMGDATDGVVDYLDGKVVYINVMNNISIDCDCSGRPSEPDMHDVGILASTDPVALDQACIDIVYATDREQSGTLIDRIESRNGLHTLEHAEDIGLGSRTYELVNIDSLEDGIVKDEPSQGNSTIILNMNGTYVKADLYDNKAAKAFKEMLPYTLTISRATDDLCGSVSKDLPSDPSEDQDTWSIGEIGWFDGWFTILCDNEEGMRKRTRTIIGKIHDEDIPFVQSLTGSVEITVQRERFGQPH